MKIVKTTFQNITLALGLSIAGLCLSANANANAMYEASTSFSLTLVDVTNSYGYTVNDYWAVSGGEYFVDDTYFTSGDGTATTTDTLAANSYVDLSIGDTVTVATSASGGAGIGIAESGIFTELELYIDNFSYYDLTFTFDYEYLIEAAVGSSTWEVGDDAIAVAGIDVLDDFFAIDIIEEVTADLLFGPYADGMSNSGQFSFTLAAYDYNLLTAYSYSDGIATGVSVPEPSTLMLLGLSLVGLGAIRLRNRA